jgi:hypothetical protein
VTELNPFISIPRASFADQKKSCAHIFKDAGTWTVPEPAWALAFLVEAGNGVTHAFLQCPECGAEAGPMTKAEVLARTPGAPIRRKATNPQCQVAGCHNFDTEWHHFAPVHLFPDPDAWPMAWLCRAHHGLWHKLTQTGVYRPRAVR